MEFVHLTRKQRVRFGDLSGPEHGPRLWSMLQAAFPAVLAVVLMPDHLHLFALLAEAAAAARRLQLVLRGFSRGIGRGLWLPPGDPEIVRGRKHVERMIRYIALNPCRDGLAPDPLCWTFSTYRDWAGASAEPWVTADDVAPVVRRHYRSAEAFHRYVSSDPSVRVTGTPFPVAAPPQIVAARSIAEIQIAAAAALRTHPDQVQRPGKTRRLFLGLARHQGWNRNRVLAEVCGITRRSARRLRTDPTSPAVQAAALCLGDPRLTLQTPPPTRAKRRPESGRLLSLEATKGAIRPFFGRL